MSLYRCTKCDVVENTALGGYWMQQLEAHQSGAPFHPLCSQCNPAIGKWHGEFERNGITAEWLQDARGFIWRPHEAETVKHLGPFVPVAI